MKDMAFASDCDGTLYFRDRTPGISDEDLEAVRRFREEGGRFGVCTGRPYYGVLDAMGDILDCDFYICTSGARIIGPRGESLAERRLSRDIVSELWEMGRSLPFMVVQANDRLYSPRPVSRKFQICVQSLDEIPEGSFLGVSFYTASPEEAEELAAYAHSRWGDTVSAFHNSICMDAVAGGVSKGGALLELKKMLGVGTMAAIGDSFNDISMLAAADISFTFPSSPEQVRAAASRIVSTVAEAIEVLEQQAW